MSAGAGAIVVRRGLAWLPVVVVSTLAVFLLVAGTGDPVTALRADPTVSDRAVERRARELGQDDPPLVRYARWAAGAARGDLGTRVTGEAVAPELRRAAAVTLRMVVAAVAGGLALAVVLGCVQAARPRSWLDSAATGLAAAVLAMPAFWLAGILQDLAVRFNQAVGHTVLSVVGERTPGLRTDLVGTVADRLGHLALPALALALLCGAEWSRFLRASMVDALDSGCVRTARAKGVPGRLVTGKHALRNALGPMVAAASTGGGRLLGGAVVTETVFGWHGMGRLLLDGLRANDAQLVAAWMLVAASAVVAAGALGDLAVAALDPRARRG